ncbi:hypothetical protein ACH4LN_27100 [Streptomyces albus]|uniref:Uncharacterized protein n=1 Tax=Streptomyces albus TaxID=1888 RepID=A0A6C1CBT8_9ACTN|nr:MULTISPECIES: hypothetical protein [Streptomyces]KPC95218.1 hypothetical protein ADL27_10730 [Streptomyces sp. NRRL F-6602]EPD93411.1 hypothetical protein HMPREF1486_03928 [Streptomyces sp. HPH0547]MDI6408850.1 hypothetical protein [Streptomyces albus]QID38992.1 hypothetical protein G3260_005757 [Streptomyces albus]TGG85499.1 hypothetical protein D8771_09985 [Streptomyces albus]
MGQHEAELCKQDMAKIETAVGNIRTAMKRVTDLMGAQTWVGPTADRWGGDFQGRMGSLNYLFNSYPAEEQRLITKAQQENKPENPK